jgi:hypothetical protein
VTRGTLGSSPQGSAVRPERIGWLSAETRPSTPAAFRVIGSIALRTAFSRRTSTLPSVLVTVALLVVLLGHNAAIIGLVDIPAGGYYLVAEMLGLIVVLAASFTAIALLLPGSSLRSR